MYTQRVYVAFTGLICIVIIMVVACVLMVKLRESSHVPPPAQGAAINMYNVAVVFTGRWKFLRILIPYLYRDLRKNGGVIDEVRFMMIKYDASEIDVSRLVKFTETANGVLGKEVFSLHYPKEQSRNIYSFPYFEMLSRLDSNPNLNFFKLDDDIVYIHPDAFSNILQAKSSKCLMHFFNIAGPNWRCSWIHQREGVYNGLNPKNLTFGFDPLAKCGWSGNECAELTLRTFLHHYHKESLDKYFSFDIEYITDQKRFSINAFLFDRGMVDFTALFKTNSIIYDDEHWWTVQYTANSDRVNCVIGKALVVHFSYFKTIRHLLATNLLKEFENILNNNRHQFLLNLELWELIGF